MKAWVVTVDMGYGHQRATYPLRDIAYDRIITANSDKLLSSREKRIWQLQQSFYEGISRLTSLPFIGKYVFNLYDRLQAISEFYPYRDLSRPNLGARFFSYLVRRKKLNQNMIEQMKHEHLPFLATHFIPALAAEADGMEDIYCVVTDTDINRAWIPLEPHKTKITYLAPCEHTVKRLKQYGVPDNKIIFTGFPLPKENIGGRDMKTLKQDLRSRLVNLDPHKKYIKWYSKVLNARLGRARNNRHKLTLTFATGGAGAQKEIGYNMLKSLRQKIKDGKIQVNLSAGTRPEIAQFFKTTIEELGLSRHMGKGVSIIFAWNKPAYFQQFNHALRKTDILWTKPSELSFYTALGLPIIMAPPIGAHEHYNKKWLLELGTGFEQEDPKYTDEWLFDIIESGRLAEAAFEGFVEAPKLGTYNIESIISRNGRKRTKNLA